MPRELLLAIEHLRRYQQVESPADLVSCLLRDQELSPIDWVHWLANILNNLVELDLSGRNLDDHCIQRLCPLLIANTTLKSLNVERNLFTDWSGLACVARSTDLKILPAPEVTADSFEKNTRGKVDVLDTAGSSELIQTSSSKTNISTNLFPIKDWCYNFTERMGYDTPRRKIVSCWVRGIAISPQNKQWLIHRLSVAEEGFHYPWKFDLISHLKFLLTDVKKLDLTAHHLTQRLRDEQLRNLTLALVGNQSVEEVILVGQSLGQEVVQALRTQISCNRKNATNPHAEKVVPANHFFNPVPSTAQTLNSNRQHLHPKDPANESQIESSTSSSNTSSKRKAEDNELEQPPRKARKTLETASYNSWTPDVIEENLTGTRNSTSAAMISAIFDFKN